MTLEQQVTSLELSKRLKELGVKQESLFYWEKRYSIDWAVTTTEDLSARKYDKYYKYISAFTASELGEMLPEDIFGKGHIYCSKRHDTGEGSWEILYRDNSGISLLEIGDTEANARAKCLIYLLENKLITL